MTHKFVGLNAVMEELWFRGVFLRPYATNVGWLGAIAVTALVYGASHAYGTYLSPGQGAVFALVVASLGLILGWAMRWADSLWGAVLFHMGMDLVIILPMMLPAA